MYSKRYVFYFPCKRKKLFTKKWCVFTCAIKKAQLRFRKNSQSLPKVKRCGKYHWLDLWSVKCFWCGNRKLISRSTKLNFWNSPIWPWNEWAKKKKERNQSGNWDYWFRYRSRQMLGQDFINSIPVTKVLTANIDIALGIAEFMC